jgi:hypothetical protein
LCVLGTDILNNRWTHGDWSNNRYFAYGLWNFLEFGWFISVNLFLISVSLFWLKLWISFISDLFWFCLLWFDLIYLIMFGYVLFCLISDSLQFEIWIRWGNTHNLNITPQLNI